MQGVLSSHICRKEKRERGVGKGEAEYYNTAANACIIILFSRRRAIGGGIDVSKFNSIVELQFTDQNTYLGFHQP